MERRGGEEMQTDRLWGSWLKKIKNPGILTGDKNDHGIYSFIYLFEAEPHYVSLAVLELCGPARLASDSQNSTHQTTLSSVCILSAGISGKFHHPHCFLFS